MGPGPLAGWKNKFKLYFEDLIFFVAHQIGDSQEMFDLVQVLLTLYENENSRGIAIFVQGESSGTTFLLKVSRILTTYRCTRLEIPEEFLVSYNIVLTSTKQKRVSV